MTNLGITPERKIPVVLADGRPSNRPAAWLEIRHLDHTAYTLVLLASGDGLTLFGAHALEGLGLSSMPREEF